MPRTLADDSDERPRRNARTPQGGNSNLALWLLIGGGALLLLFACGGAAGVVALLRLRSAAVVVRGPSAGLAADGVPGALAHWTFDEAPGGRAADSAGRVGAATLLGCGLGPGVRGKAVHLGGAPGQYADLGGSTALSFPAGRDFAFAGWFQTAEPAGVILSLRSSKSERPQIDVIVRNGSLLFVLGDDNDPGQDNAAVWGAAVADGRWHHFAAMRAGGEAILYLDGKFQGRKRAAASAGPVTTDLRAVGSERLWATTGDNRWGPATFRGAVDDLWAFDRALTEAEVASLAGR